MIFTSIEDDAHGGDSNGDGPSIGLPGDWDGIDFTETVDSVRANVVLSKFGFSNLAFGIYLKFEISFCYFFLLRQS